MGLVQSLSGAQLPRDPTTVLEATPMQYVDSRVGLILNDFQHYGDMWSTLPRMLFTGAKTMVNGTITYTGSIAADSFTATKLRLFSTGAAAGTGTLQAKVFTGSVQASLTPVASITNLTAVAANTMNEVALSASVSIAPGLLVYVGVLTTGFTTTPTIQALPNSGGPANFLSPAGRVWTATSATGQTALPTVAISMASQTASGLPLWAALV